MLKRKAFGQGTLLIASLVAAMVLFAGCGGSGGGAAGGSGFSSLNMTVEFPEKPGTNRAAEQISDITYTAAVAVLDYSSDASASPTTKASTSVDLTYNSISGTYSGTFMLGNIPVGNNYIVKITKCYTCSESGETYTDGYIGALVETISSGTTQSVTVNATSTVAALATLRYALTHSASAVAMSNTSVVTSSIIDAIEEAVELLWSANASSYTSYIFYSYYNDPFDTSTWSTNTSLTTLLDAVIAEAIKPNATKFYIDSTEISKTATTATNVSAESPVFKVVFAEAMDTSLTFSTSTISTDLAGFGIAIERDDTGSTLTINSSNALSYGDFAWTTTTITNDTLTFTLKPNAVLEANGRKTLTAGKTYNITSWTAPSNLKTADGDDISARGISTSGSFTVATGQPTVSKFMIDSVDVLASAESADYVDAEAPVFAVVFSETMDEMVDLNATATLSASGLIIKLERSDTGGTLTIDSSNALSYGEFDWTTTISTNDTLTFTLKSSTELSDAGRKTLQAGGITYYITDWTAPSNVTDADGNRALTTGLSTTGSFTTQ
ncbi:MAG: hypothetical protein ABIH66_04280 [bacterium]